MAGVHHPAQLVAPGGAPAPSWQRRDGHAFDRAQKDCARRRLYRSDALAGVDLAPALALGLLGGLASSNRSAPSGAPKASPPPARQPSTVEITMLLHQAHYFSYCYAMPLLLASDATGGVALIGVWFACGWITYLAAEALWQRFPPRTVFVAGHVFLTVLLGLLSLFHSMPWVALSLWVLSGLGGGTVYCLSLLHADEGRPPKRLEQAEDIGHMLGVAAALGSVLLLRWDASLLPALGSFWAASAAAVIITSAFAHRRSGHRANHLS